jgi:hypothetical protein
MLGHPIEHPTTPQAAAVFGASTSMIALVLKERTQYGCPPPLPPLDALWATLDSGERAAFIMRNETAIWKAIDKITAQSPAAPVANDRRRFYSTYLETKKKKP